MATAAKLPEEPAHDKVTEKRMAELIGTTAKALQRKRERNIIPAGVWMKIDGRIMYSKWRYDEWLENLWSSRPVSSLLGNPSESGSQGASAAAVRRSPTPRRRKASPQQQVYVLR